jgi:hypothetical protein
MNRGRGGYVLAISQAHPSIGLSAVRALLSHQRFLAQPFDAPPRELPYINNIARQPLIRGFVANVILNHIQMP